MPTSRTLVERPVPRSHSPRSPHVTQHEQIQWTPTASRSMSPIRVNCSTAWPGKPRAMGFCVIPHGINPHTHNSRLYNFLAGGYGDMFDTWCRTHGRKYVRINVWFTSPIPPTGPLTASVCLWKFEIPRTKRMRPIVVGLDLVCDHMIGNYSKYQVQQACMAARRPITVQRMTGTNTRARTISGSNSCWVS